MRINLLDIGEEGHEFTGRLGEDAEVDRLVRESIEDLKTYDYRVHISKAGDIFTAAGRIGLEKGDQCSSCGHDINTKVDRKFTEYLMNETGEAAQQKGHAPHSGLNLNNDQEVTFVQGFELNLGDFVREQLAIAAPLYPRCADQAACLARQKEIQKYMAEEKAPGHPAFSVLSKLKK